MYENRDYTIKRGIHPYDGYQGEPIWKDPTTSTLYDYETDKQCRVPIRDRESIKKELGIK